MFAVWLPGCSLATILGLGFRVYRVYAILGLGYYRVLEPQTPKRYTLGPSEHSPLLPAARTSVPEPGAVGMDPSRPAALNPTIGFRV